MGRVTRAFGHLSEDEIRQRIREAKTAWIGQKWLVILHATIDPIPTKEIALHVGVGKGTVHNLISDKKVRNAGYGTMKFTPLKMQKPDCIRFASGFSASPI
ncbi:MAG: hypothetical protein ACLQPD_24250 [Desulfomonilaceae bacterium]